MEVVLLLLLLLLPPLLVRPLLFPLALLLLDRAADLERPRLVEAAGDLERPRTGDGPAAGDLERVRDLTEEGPHGVK